jgi:hypothetical protein
MPSLRPILASMFSARLSPTRCFDHPCRTLCAGDDGCPAGPGPGTGRPGRSPSSSSCGRRPHRRGRPDPRAIDDRGARSVGGRRRTPWVRAARSPATGSPRPTPMVSTVLIRRDGMRHGGRPVPEDDLRSAGQPSSTSGQVADVPMTLLARRSMPANTRSPELIEYLRTHRRQGHAGQRRAGCGIPPVRHAVPERHPDGPGHGVPTRARRRR